MQSCTIDELEYYIANCLYEQAAVALLNILTGINRNAGAIQDVKVRYLQDDFDKVAYDHNIFTRIANAISQLFSNKDFILSEKGFHEFIVLHRWIGTLYSVSALGNADHVIRMMGGVNTDGVNININHPSILKICLLYTPQSQLSLSCDALWMRSPKVCAALSMAILSQRSAVSNSAYQKRELLLQWLPKKLDQLHDASVLPGTILHDVWMHCSYSMVDNKHAIKASLNRLIRNQLLSAGYKDCTPANTSVASTEKKPVILIPVEWFNSNHSIYRTHSESMLTLRKHFTLIGLGFDSATDQITRAMFDVFIPCDMERGLNHYIHTLVDTAKRYKPQIVYYLSVGMFPHTIYAINLRLASIQCVAHGHAASTFSEQMDYFLMDEDIIGDANTYSENIISLPVGTTPYILPKFLQNIPGEHLNTDDAVIVAVPGTIMKINPYFLTACRNAQSISKKRLEFRFLPGFAIGVSGYALRKEIDKQLPGSVVFDHLTFNDYLIELQKCDFFICPYPYGNTNTIVDAVLVGLQGICVLGKEPHSAIDAGLFKRLGLPNMKIIESLDEYPSAIACYADNIYINRRPKTMNRELIHPLLNHSNTNLGDVLYKILHKHSRIYNVKNKTITTACIDNL